MGNKPLNILLINYDWRDIYREKFYELEEKLERDRLNPKSNNFFIFSWAHQSYFLKSNNRFATRHQKIVGPFFKPLYDFLALFFVPYQVKKNNFKPDIITTYDFGSLPAAWLVSKFSGGRVIMTINNMPRVYSATRSFGGLKSIYSYLLEKLFYRLPEFYFTINQAMKDYLVSIGIPAEWVKLFSMNTIKRDWQYLQAAQAGVIRQKYGLKPEEKIIITVARLEAEKDYPRMLRAFSRLDKTFHFISLGRGSLLPELKKLAAELGVSERVHFAGFVERDEIWNYYRDADVFMLLSRAEALGVVFWEAMYMNVPAIGSTAEGIIESIGRNNERGFVWQAGETDEKIKKDIDFCLTPSEQRTAMLERAKQYVEAQIANDTTINDIVS